MSIKFIQTQSIVDAITSVELEALMDTYNYGPAGDGGWASKDTGEVVLQINEEFTEVVILGNPQNVIPDLNWILMRGGWESCQVICDDDDMFDMILRYLTNLRVADRDENMAATTPPATAGSVEHLTNNADKAGLAGTTELQQPTAPERATTPPAPSSVPPAKLMNTAAIVEEQFTELQEKLKEKIQALASAEEQISILEDQLRQKQKGTVALPSNGNLANQLLLAIENHLTTTVQSNELLNTPLAKELQKLGIAMRVSVTLEKVPTQN